MLRAAAVLLGLAAYGASRSVVPLFAARPPVLLGEAGFAWAPGAAAGAGIAIAVVGLVVALEALVRRRDALTWTSALEKALAGYAPLSCLVVFGLLFFPGIDVVPMALWWLLLDGSPWLLTVVLLATLSGKTSFVPPPSFRWLRSARGTALFGAVLLGLVLLWTPERRLTQPYDERWGTGDEPRYVRITASLLHDGDADVANAEEHVGRRASPLRFLAGALGWIPSAIATATEASAAYLGDGRPGRATSLGGPVIEGRRGGLYYSFLPGLPLLLAPAMLVDTYVDPGRLAVTLFFCMLLGVAFILALERLVEPFAGGAAPAYALAGTIALSLPVFFYHFQVYTEIAAAILLAAVLWVLLSQRHSLARAVVFGLACGYLPWLHGKYLPFWGVAVLAFSWKERFDRRWAAGLGLAGAGLLTNCLYVFHITGSLMPDALWTLRGYEREATLVSESTIPGLLYLFLSRDEGLFVYAPHYALAIPASLALWRRSRYALALGVGLSVPYVLAAASHDQGGAGAWSPPSRYLVPLVPVLALALASWLEPRKTRPARFAVLLAAASASFWMAQGMLDARNFPYDRPAFLASGLLDPSPLLTASGAGYGLVLASALALFVVSERRGLLTSERAYLGAVGLVVAGGTVLALDAPRLAWVPSRPPSAFRLRSSEPRAVQLPECPRGTPRIRFQGTGGVHEVRVRGPGADADIRVPSGTATELPVEVEPIRFWTRSGARAYRMLSVRLAGDERPVDVEAICR